MDNTDSIRNVYAEDEPDIGQLAHLFNETVTQLDSWFEQLSNNYDDRRNHWPGKSRDLRKWGVDATPWEGASDNEAHVINERVNTLVSMCLKALDRSNIRAFPVEAGDAERSRVVSAFLKWMVSSYIKDFRSQVELGANHLFEKGLMVTRVSWHNKLRTFLQEMSMEEIIQMSPDFAELIADASNDDAVVAVMMEVFPGLLPKRAKKALKQLRRTGFAELTVAQQTDEGPRVRALAPDTDVFLPSWLSCEAQSAPWYFERVLMTPQDILGNVATQGWDAEWADHVIENLHGAEYDLLNDTDTYNRSFQTRTTDVGDNELVEVLYCYQRLIDPDDGAEGIYCTVFHRRHTDDSVAPAYAKHSLMNGLREFPIVVSRLSHDQKRLYDGQSIPEMLRGLQYGIKAQRDQRDDASQLQTLRPILYKSGRPIPKWEPGASIPKIRSDDYEFADGPGFNPGSVEIETTYQDQADRICGLSPDRVGQQDILHFYVSKLLEHVRDVVKLAYRQFTQYGPEEVWFRVSGFSDPQRFQKGGPDEDFDVVISFDTLNQDPDTVEKMFQQFALLKPYDVEGRIDAGELVEFGAGMISPALADRIIQPKDESAQDMQRETAEDWTKLFSGVEVGARPGGAQMRLQMIQQILQQPDVSEAMQSNEALAERVQKYVEQMQFQMQQAQNAEIGRIGTEPAAFQGVNQ